MFVYNKKLIVTFSLLILFLIKFNPALPIGYCNPIPCPEGYSESDAVCNNGICYISCGDVIGCNDNYITVYNDSEYLPDLNIASYSGAFGKWFELGKYAPADTSKCYRFRQTTPNNFISSSDIDNYYDLDWFNSGIALFWADYDTDSMWFDNQNYYSTGEFSNYIWSDGGVWVDSCTDDGDNFNSADSFSRINTLYCAPTQKACDDFNSTYCDTDCYNHPTELELVLLADWLDEGTACNSFTDFDVTGDGTGGEIDYVNFDSQTVYMYVDEYDAIINASFNNTCSYWPECNPAEPCCNQSGYFRPSSFVCKNAHNEVCSNPSSCSGTAYEDRCSGTSATCPDNNYLITYNEACDDLTCVSQSCSGSTLQPERTCSAGTCQINNAYECPNNLKCQDSVSCKKQANISSDCKTGYSFSSENKVCYSDEGVLESLVYDNNGNLISGFGLNYTYDDFNQLINIRNNTGNLLAVYAYDENSNRIRKTIYKLDGTNETTYYFDNFVQVVNSSGIFNESYYYYYNILVGKKDNNGNLLFYHPDNLGSTTLITNSSGGVVSYLQYEPFGDLIESSNERYSYTGHENDAESSLLYYGARYYDPEIGKFLQADPIIGDLYNPQDLNKYAYVRNNPYKYTDPNGEWINIAIGAVGGGLTASLYALYKQTVLGEYMSYSDLFSTVGAGVASGAVFGGTFGLASGALRATTTGGSILAAGGAGTFAGSLAGETGLITSSVLSGNVNILKDPMAPAETVGYGGLTGGILGLAGSAVGAGVGNLRGGSQINKIPSVSDAKLQNYVNDFYKGINNPNRIGSGTTADAIRYELETGESVGGKLHTQKGKDLIRGLNNWIKKNPNADSKETDIAKSIVKDIESALGGPQ